jgi:metallo-beta-lactamase family protein
VAAEICQLPGVSGHADREGLVEWARGFHAKPLRCFVVHGEDTVTDIFAGVLKEQLGWDTMAPYSGTVYDLAANVCVKETTGIPFVKRDTEGNPVVSKERVSTPYLRLEKTAERLLAIIHANRGLANKDIAKFADQLNALCDKWDR